MEKISRVGVGQLKVEYKKTDYQRDSSWLSTEDAVELCGSCGLRYFCLCTRYFPAIMDQWR